MYTVHVDVQTLVNKNLISAKLTWRWIKYLGLLFPLMVIVPIPFPSGLPAWLSWMGDPWAREQASLQSTQKREINKSPRPDARHSHTPQQSQAGRVSTDGKSGLFPCSEIWFEAGML